MTSEKNTSSIHTGAEPALAAHGVVGTGARDGAPRIGVVGGGQLARMMEEAANALGIELDALVESADGSAAQVIPLSTVGAADDREAVVALASRVDALTVEHEHVPDSILAAAAECAPVRPSAAALAYAQDKGAMRRKMEELGIPCPRWTMASSVDDVARAIDAWGGRVVLKTPRDGYDGKGVAIISQAAEAQEWLERGELLVEEVVPFEMEVAQLVARRPSGEIATWPVVQTTQQQGACYEVIAPAPGISQELAEKIRSIAEKIATQLDVTGILAVELFLARDQDGTVQPYVNELAMRPHNSGHWSIEGAVTGQFEQHLRAVLDLPLGSTQMRAPYAVMVNVLGSALADPRIAYPDVMKEFPEAKIHMYGKAVAYRRKLGHVTVVGDNLEQMRAAAHGAAALLRGETSSMG